MQMLYEGPEELVEKMKSLSLSQDCSLGGEFRFRVAPVDSRVIDQEVTSILNKLFL